MPVVLITPEPMLRQRQGPHVKMLEETGFQIVYPQDPTFTRGLMSPQQTREQLSVCDAVIAGGERFSRDVLAGLPRLRVIARLGVGYERVDIAAATECGIAVTITPTANHEAVAEHTLMLLLAVAKRLPFGQRALRSGKWPMQSTRPVRRTTLGILGLGRIGRSLAIRARALGMTVIATEPAPDAAFVRQQGLELVDFDALLARADHLSIHCPLNEATRGLFNAAALARMKPGSVLINAARGGLVVERDLIASIESGHLAGAGLDCFEQEPPSPSNRLFEMDQVVCTPHIAANDTLSQFDMAIEAARCIKRLYQGQWPRGAVVNDELQDRFKWLPVGAMRR